ncbi:hypothetical protein [Vibrio parahaemolyticus]|uniref:hypothetical protein n=1 Tax=Vibrio harveyi group TaxID=717610 RepID=UPI001122EDF0|nr:hypothetical protein [Vibrio parahaemolyticus]QLE36303.1 hypothetical protein FDV79_11465 [Vibrio parahaemolyticus]TOQ94818.1 hypothetical protein CGG84_23115 [Vibrio parahaemolyticus]
MIDMMKIDEETLLVVIPFITVILGALFTVIAIYWNRKSKIKKQDEDITRLILNLRKERASSPFKQPSSAKPHKESGATSSAGKELLPSLTPPRSSSTSASVMKALGSATQQAKIISAHKERMH